MFPLNSNFNSNLQPSTFLATPPPRLHTFVTTAQHNALTQSAVCNSIYASPVNYCYTLLPLALISLVSSRLISSHSSYAPALTLVPDPAPYICPSPSNLLPPHVS